MGLPMILNLLAIGAFIESLRRGQLFVVKDVSIDSLF